MKNYSKPVSIAAKIVEVLFWFAAAALLLAMCYSLLDPYFQLHVFPENYAEMDLYGLRVSGENISPVTFRTLMVFGSLTLSLSAMIARNISIISRKLAGKASFSEENSPFSETIVRLVREIGYFAISVTILSFLFSFLLRWLTNGSLEISTGLEPLFLGLVVLYLSTIFQYGVELQKDVDGLV